ncbi:hypothetical protein A2U01_0031419, partial [Trifolium medium]|nr:hypothetical protein [Trifolium medium]
MTVNERKMGNDLVDTGSIKSDGVVYLVVEKCCAR